jgi:RimJ/RimL family protein N-acetyltransferase
MHRRIAGSRPVVIEDASHLCKQLAFLFAIPVGAGYERQMLGGELIGLRARQDSDFEVFETELLNDVETRMRADSRPWRPITPGSADSPYRAPSHRDDVVVFSVVELATGELAGEALVWGIDLHNRNAHLGLSLRPAFRGKHLGTDIVRVLCRYGFAIRGFHRLQVDTLTDNHAMIGAATRAGFVIEGTLRQRDWVNGSFADEVILGQLATEWRPADPYSGR